ncbi:DUF72 domain-containing protein [Pedobacter sp. GR22-6]|uniref:DUF72 domain-containing protein n=1 Tax=Pedobacter sp. GR22-6 TaxID=3127957 RepID=UPI003FCEC5EF
MSKVSANAQTIKCAGNQVNRGDHKLCTIFLIKTLFINNLELFDRHLGPILLQLGDNFPSKSLPDLEHFVKNLPNNYRFVIELRHEEWFSDPAYRKAAFDLFRDHHIGTVITDAHGRRDCLHMELTIPEAYIRFNGTDGQNRTIDYLRIDDWSKRINMGRQWASETLLHHFSTR